MTTTRLANLVMDKNQAIWIFVLFFVANESLLGNEPTIPPAVKRTVDFAREVYPLLRDRCFDCHQGANPAAGIRLDYHAKMLGTSDGIPLVVVGQSEQSHLIRVTAGAIPDKSMPPADAGPALTAAEIGLLRAWIDQGAQWDAELLPDPNLIIARQHWAFQSVVRPAIPEITADFHKLNPHLAQANGEVHPLDALVGEQQNRLNLAATEPATKRTLIRRLYLVLHGLPPTPEQVDLFLNDAAPGAWQQVVERVLQSTHYGERIARHWLDSARWAESEGFAQNNDRPFAWRYRDYVINSFNQDKPYSEFLRQQIAGDELEPYRDENLIATGFLAAARISSDDLHFYRVENDMYTDIVSTISSSVLGLTIGCSQCHDHKFDPISQRDFYRLQAFFTQGLAGNVVLAAAPHPEAIDRVAQELLQYDLQVRRRVLGEGFDKESPAQKRLFSMAESERTLAEERSFRPARIKLNIHIAGCNGFRIHDDEKKKLEELRNELKPLVDQAEQTWGFYSPVTSPHTLTTLPMAGNFPFLHDKETLTNRRSYLLARGQIFEPVAVVKPGWPAVFGPTLSPHLESRPRTALADWLTSPQNPLTARVWVNRLWQMHFGRGLVETPGNFGVRGAQPTHPKLLDWLAAELMDHGWSTKHIHRLIVTSQIWQQSSSVPFTEAQPQKKSAPDKSLELHSPTELVGWPRRRLEAEAIRDSMLVASGTLENTIGGAAVPISEEASSSRRGLYLFQKRDAPPAMQSLFDGPTAMSESCVTRQVSTSALQALYLLNNDFSRQRSRLLADRIVKLAGDNVTQQIEVAFKLTLGRPPEQIEAKAIRAFLQQQQPRTSAKVSEAETPPSPASSQIPTESLSLWLRADAGVSAAEGVAAQDQDAITCWLDQAVGGNHFVDQLLQTTGHRQPRFVNNLAQNLNGLPMIRFAGGPFGQADQFLETADQQELHLTDGYTLFAVVRFNGKGQRNEVIFFKARNGGNDLGQVGLIRTAADGKITVGQNINGQWGDRIKSAKPVPDGAPVVIVAHWNGQQLELEVLDAEGRFSIDTTELAGSIDPGQGGKASVGGYIDGFSDDGERLNGDLGEILLYRTALSAEEKTLTREYLTKRWLAGPKEPTPLELVSQALMNLNEFLYIE
ncbi:MAG: DUF1553 domain-containing protein [Pirellulaceae bacterium]|nr:DUF1553 domain-containing protein [Pirellulaceae bacterium]